MYVLTQLIEPRDFIISSPALADRPRRELNALVLLAAVHSLCCC